MRSKLCRLNPQIDIRRQPRNSWGCLAILLIQFWNTHHYIFAQYANIERHSIKLLLNNMVLYFHTWYSGTLLLHWRSLGTFYIIYFTRVLIYLSSFPPGSPGRRISAKLKDTILAESTKLDVNCAVHLSCWPFGRLTRLLHEKVVL